MDSEDTVKSYPLLRSVAYQRLVKADIGFILCAVVTVTFRARAYDLWMFSKSIHESKSRVHLLIHVENLVSALMLHVSLISKFKIWIPPLWPCES
jgi:hypothetical protein